MDLIACNNYINGLKAVKKIKCPTFFVCGEIDKMVKVEKSKEFAGLISNSKFHIIKNCGHMIILKKLLKCVKKLHCL